MSDGVHLLNRPTELTSRYLVESASLPGIGYVVIVVGTTAACPCLAFKYRGRCRHTGAVLAHLAESLPGLA